MCIFNLTDNEKEIATKEIKVLKVIKKDKIKGLLKSPIFDDELWKIGEEKVVEFNIIEDRFEFRDKRRYQTTTGIYSYEYDLSCDTNLYLSFFSFFGKDLEIYEAIIPENAEYIKEGNQYCSNKLKLIKRII